MNSIKYVIFMMALCTQACWAQILVPATKANEAQLLMQERGYGMFIHFGINTFADTEWSDGSIPVSKYHPTDLNCDQWIRVARDAGFRYVILTTKHHDGFCLWDSKYTKYDVASSPVKTDIVSEVSKACKKYGLKFGVYYSLWDRNHPSGKDRDPKKYIDYMCDQLTELLTNYGDVCELWFDGGWDRKENDWDLPRVYKLIKKLQPQCAVGVNHTIVYKEGERKFALPDSMTVDNKYYFQYFPSDFRLWDPKIAHKLDKKQYLHQGQSYYLPYEHTICISKYWSWFSKSVPQPTRDLDELEELFYWCTDNGNTLVMNVPPNQKGQIGDIEANAIIRLGHRLNIQKGQPLPKNGELISLGATVEASSTKEPLLSNKAANAVDGGMQTAWTANDTTATLTVHLDRNKAFNKITIFEKCDAVDSEDGFTNIRSNRIQKYHIDLNENGVWSTIYTDDTPMGDCKVIRFPKEYRASELRLYITKAKNLPSIYELNVFNM